MKMSEYGLKIAVRSAFRFAQFLTFKPSQKNGRFHAVILPASSSGSVGDQAMIEALITSLKKKGFARIDVIRYKKTDNWGTVEQDISGSVAWPMENPKTWIECAKCIAEASHFFILGADVLDGKYGFSKSFRMVELANLAARFGVDTRICGFSFNSNPSPAMIKAFKRLPASVNCYSRDPVSARRFQELTGRNSFEVSDLAFLLQPSEERKSIDRVFQWIGKQRSSGQQVMGVNLNFLPFTYTQKGSSKKTIERIRENFIDLFTEFKELSVVMVPHDSRGGGNDEWFAKKIYRALPDFVKPRCYLIEKAPQAGEVKAIARELDFAISGRMHFLIALLGSNVPAIGIAYQGKFEGLNRLFGFENMTIEPYDFLKKEVLFEAVSKLINEQHIIKQQIISELPKVYELAESQLPELIQEGKKL